MDHVAPVVSGTSGDHQNATMLIPGTVVDEDQQSIIVCVSKKTRGKS
jgi:hypothetical protein